MEGRWYTTGGDRKGWLLLLGVAAGVLLAGSGAVAAVSEMVIVLLAVAGGVVALAVGLGVWLLVRMHRRGAFAPVVSYRPQLPAPEPRRVIPPVQPPQQITNNFYGYSPADVARAVAGQQAIDEGR